MDKFDQQKQNGMSKLKEAIDKSPKGSLDEPIVDLIHLINKHINYMTTSSCSGRISLFKNNEKALKGGKWLIASHDTVTMDHVYRALEYDAPVALKHEPFVMHVMCRNMDAATMLLQCALSCGFRESGIVVGKHKITVGIRTTASMMEVPIIDDGALLPSKDYLEYLIKVANGKFVDNRARTDRLYDCLVAELSDGSQPCMELKQYERVTVAKCLLSVGHSMTKVSNDSFVLFGGFGMAGTHAARSNQVYAVHGQSNPVLVEMSGDIPKPRMHHSMVYVEEMGMVLFGGRAGPVHAFNDVYVLDLKQSEWTALHINGSTKPSPRWGHTAVLVRDEMYIIGGRNESQTFNDVFVLVNINIKEGSAEWRQLDTSIPVSLYGHAAVLGSEFKIYVFGGMQSLTGSISGELYVFNISTKVWTTTKLVGNAPLPRFGHSFCDLKNDNLLLVGGTSRSDSEAQTQCYMLNLKAMKWKKLPIEIENLKQNHLWTYHTAITIGSKLCIVGGGMQCFGFGHFYSLPLQLDLRKFLALNDKPLVQPGTLVKTKTPTIITALKSNLKSIKVALEKEGLYDKSRKICPSPDQPSMFHIPAFQMVGMEDMLLRLQSMAVEEVYEVQNINDTSSLYGVLVRKQRLKEVKVLLEADHLFDNSRRIRPYSETDGRFLVPILSCSISKEKSELSKLQIVVDSDVKWSKTKIANPQHRITQVIIDLVEKHSLPKDLIDAATLKYEKVGDVLMVPQDSFLDELWTPHFEELWSELCTATSCVRVARKAFICDNLKRQSKVELLYCPPHLQPKRTRNAVGWVDLRENGLSYSFDITKVMFCSGNVTEKERMGRIGCQGETIVDMYAGIGYYVIPFLVHGKASFVYALEWNEDSIKALICNLQQNNVADKCKILFDDNRISSWTLGRTADRVNLGLIPSSEDVWSSSIHVLKDTGGWLHIHGNVHINDHTSWIHKIQTTVESYIIKQNRNFQVQFHHLERVKSYAPNVDHLVADFYIKQV